VDMITITSYDGILKDLESTMNLPLFPENHRPHKYFIEKT